MNIWLKKSKDQPNEEYFEVVYDTEPPYVKPEK